MIFDDFDDDTFCCCRYHNKDEKQLKDFKTFNEYWAYKNSYKETDFIHEIDSFLMSYIKKKYRKHKVRLDEITYDLCPELIVEIVNEVRDKEVVFSKPIDNLSLDEIKRLYNKSRFQNKFIDNSDFTKFRVLIIYINQCYLKNTKIFSLLHQLKLHLLGV